jgi:hypothetical protein
MIGNHPPAVFFVKTEHSVRVAALPMETGILNDSVRLWPKEMVGRTHTGQLAGDGDLLFGPGDAARQNGEGEP